MMISNVLFSIVAISEPNLNLLSIIVFTDSFSAGIVGTVNIAFLNKLGFKAVYSNSICTINFFHDATRQGI